MTGLIRLEPGQTRAALPALLRAFADDPLWNRILPDPSRRGRAMRALFGFHLRYSALGGEVWATGDDCTAVAAWLPAEHAASDSGPLIRAGALALPFTVGLGNLGRLAKAGDAIKMMRADHAPRDYRYLALLGVDPTRQRQGLGSALLKPMLERCDSERLPIWLETEREENTGYYARHGFALVARIVVPRLNIPLWGMLRPPAAPGRGRPAV